MLNNSTHAKTIRGFSGADFLVVFILDTEVNGVEIDSSPKSSKSPIPVKCHHHSQNS